MGLSSQGWVRCGYEGSPFSVHDGNFGKLAGPARQSCSVGPDSGTTIWAQQGACLRQLQLLANAMTELEQKLDLDFLQPCDALRLALQGRTQDLRFGRSRVHAWGLFAKQDIEPEQFMIEYVGQV